PEYRARIPPGQRGGGSWRGLVFPFRLRDAEVEKIADIPYLPDGDRRRAHRLDVYRNRAHPTGCPVFVYIHGGAWVMGDKREQGRPLLLHLAAHGWLCFAVNYRLSPKATWPDHLDDVEDAIRWVKQHAADYGGDP